MRKDDKYYSPAFEELRQLAYSDWAAFCRRVGDEVMLNAIICSLRERGFSMGRISLRYNLTKRKVQYIVENKCKCNAIQKSAKGSEQKDSQQDPIG